MKSNPQDSPRRLGFTLMELLVVISIIAALAAILILLNGRMRKQADSVESVLKLRQLSLAAISYASDNQSILPYATGSLHWTTALAPYAGVIFNQDNVKLQPDLYRSRSGMKQLSPADQRDFAVNFSLNQMSSSPPEDSFTHWGKYTTLRSTIIPEPEKFRLFGDRAGTWRGWHGIFETKLVGFNYNNRANFSYLDGHVTSIPRSEMEKYTRIQWVGGSKANTAALGFNDEGK